MADEVKLTYISGLSGLTANVFSGDGETQRNDGNAVTLSDTGHLGLYLGDCSDIRAGDVIIFYLNDVYLTGTTYEIIDWVTIATTEAEVLNITLCNQALGLLGAEEISADNQTAPNYLLCEQYYADSRDEILVSHPWNWASITAYFIETTALLPGYDNAFTVPSACLRALTIEADPLAKWKRRGSVIVTNEGNTPPGYDEDGVDYLAGQYILSDDSGSDLTYLVDTAFTSSSETSDLATYCTSQDDDLKILEVEYIQQVADVSTYPVFMNKCLYLNLAITLSSPILQAANSKIFLNLQTSLFGGPKTWGYMNIAKAIDAQEAGGETITTNKFLNARRTGRRV